MHQDAHRSSSARPGVAWSVAVFAVSFRGFFIDSELSVAEPRHAIGHSVKDASGTTAAEELAYFDMQIDQLNRGRYAADERLD